MHEGMPTPWGVADKVHVLDEGVFWVHTTEHGGLLLEHTQAEALLSSRAIALGEEWNAFLTFEQENAMLVVFYEHPELYPWAEETLIKPLAEECLRRVYPGYFNESMPALHMTQGKRNKSLLDSLLLNGVGKSLPPDRCFEPLKGYFGKKITLLRW